MTGLTSFMRTEACLAAWKNGVSLVYLKLPLFFSKEALYSLCRQTIQLLLRRYRNSTSLIKMHAYKDTANHKQVPYK